MVGISSTLTFIFLQTTHAVADSVATAGPVETNVTMLDLIMKGGWVMVPIFLLLGAAIYLFVERYTVIKKAGAIDQGLIVNVCQNIANGNLKSASSLCNANQNLIARILEKGIMRLGSPIQEIEGGMSTAAKTAVAGLEKNMGVLAAIAALAPMFGFLGTVFGMIQAFSAIAVSDNLSIGSISEGIYTKMVTSAAGLIVGILAHMAYVALNTMLDRTILSLEVAATEFVDFLYNPQR